MSAPSYIQLYDNGELFDRIDRLNNRLEECVQCARVCGANRAEDETGTCGGGKSLKVSSAFAHFGEEPPLVGLRGSGTIFLTDCNLRCVFCQNYDISHQGQGAVITPSQLATIMIELQRAGCHNINFVTPTHYTASIIAALPEAVEAGLELPIVWNCGGYESVETIRLLDGIVDIYMPDIKFGDAESAQRYADAPDYPEVAKRAVREMHRQVGDLALDNRGIARRGLLVRHLVMPNNTCGTEEILRFVAEEISKETYINIMDQYRPMYKSCDHEEINRPTTREEWDEAVRLAKELGLSRGF